MNSEKNGTVCWYSNASPNKVRTPHLSASAETSVSNRLFPMPGGPSMTSTPPRPLATAATSAPITFNSSARPRIGGVTSRWPPTSERPVEDPTGRPIHRLLNRHCTACHSRHPPIQSERGARNDASTMSEASVEIDMPDDYRLPREANRALVQAILAVRDRMVGSDRGVA